MSFYRVSWTEEMAAIIETDSKDEAIKVAMGLDRRDCSQLGLVDLEVEELEEDYESLDIVP